MKRKLLAFMDLAAKIAERDKIIKESTRDNTFVKWSDDAVETKECLYILKVITFNFPIQNFAGYDSVEAPEILKELKSYLSELEMLCEINSDQPESSDSDENEKDDRNDSEDDKSSEERE